MLYNHVLAILLHLVPSLLYLIIEVCPTVIVKYFSSNCWDFVLIIYFLFPSQQHQIPNSPPVYNVDNVGGTTAGYIGSPQALSYPHQSPLSSHSPRISPEPGHHLSTSSYPSSVPDLQYPSSVAELQSGTGGRGVASGVASGTMAGTIISNGPVELVISGGCEG